MTEARPTPAGTGASGGAGDSARRSNLATVLSLVHHDGPHSRAELTRATGLNRSTIATLATQLAELGLAYEAAPMGSNAIGRPSPTVHADASTAAIAINPEIDAITVGLVGLGGGMLHRVRHETPAIPSAREVVDISAAIVHDIRSRPGAPRIVGVGVAVPGLTRAEDGMVTYAPHLEWNDEPIAQLLREATGFPVRAANDASLGANAEKVFGAGRGADNILYLNGGASGIGGGVISGGALLTGAAGYAGELGHTLVSSGGALCHCGANGCLETEVSRAPLLDALGLAPGESERLEDELGAAYASDAPPAALARVVDAQVGFLGIALRNAVNLLNPGVIVLGGFLGLLHAVAPVALDRAMRGQAMRGPRDDVRIERARLGRDILMVGAAELAFADILANPRAVAPPVP
ncbi:ROK family protein [Planctomonas psychrotolerans]|uniref:ROK family protein n=1 Tax=Planctomonas psychrotolerans TaxID=2528712 RepID=UPI00123BDE53|nr:ROK family protein [Planctomonas psychrotolerans]